MGPRTQWIETGDFPEMVRCALQIVEQKANGCQAIVHVWSVELLLQGLRIELPSLLVVPLSNGLTGLLAQIIDRFANHGPGPAHGGGRTTEDRVFRPIGPIISGLPWQPQPQKSEITGAT